MGEIKLEDNKTKEEYMGRLTTLIQKMKDGKILSNEDVILMCEAIQKAFVWG